MKKLFVLLATLLATTPAWAWSINAPNSPHSTNATSDSGPVAASNASAAARSQSTATSRSKATGGNASSTGGTAVVNNNGSGNGSGGGNTMSPPSLYSANTCAAGISIAGFGGFGGGGGGAQWELHDCRLRALAQLLDNRGDHAGAKNVYCQISEAREAYALTDAPCPDKNATRQAAVVAPVAATTQPVSTPNQKYRFDYCYTASPGELRQHKECIPTPVR